MVVHCSFPPAPLWWQCLARGSIGYLHNQFVCMTAGADSLYVFQTVAIIFVIERKVRATWTQSLGSKTQRQEQQSPAQVP